MRRGNSQRGSLLILALWTLALFASLSVSLGAAARSRASLLSRLEIADRLRAVSLCGVERARAEVLSDPTPDLDTRTDGWANDPPAFRATAVGGGVFTVSYAAQPARSGERPRVRYGARDAESLLNLNSADAESIARLFERAAEVPRDEALGLAMAVVDWRDNDSQYQHPDLGAEDTDYDDLPKPYACKDAPFDDPEELLLLKGMKRAIFDKVRPHITLHGSGSVNINTATRQTLLALGLDEGAVSKIVAFRAGEDGIDGNGDDVVFTQAQVIVSTLDRASPPLDGAQRAKVSDLILAEKLGTQSSAFLVSSRGAVSATAEGDPTGPYLETEAVFERGGKVLYMRSSGVRWPSRN